jgi:hypothetical protein
MNSPVLLRFFAGCTLVFVFACSTSEGASSREVKKETKEKRKSPIILSAEGK